MPLQGLRMAKVFLSYDHDDAKRVAPIAAALEQAGHSVWWDRHIAAGAEYNEEIEGAVERADVVVVAWTEQSIHSAWVRDEAAEGRDTGKLIPVILDSVKPPMGFRQYQTIDLSNSKGRRTQRFEGLIDAVEKLAPFSEAPLRSEPRRGSGEGRLAGKWPLLTIVAAVLAVIAFATWRLIDKPSAVPVVAVLPASSSPDAEAMARDLLVKLGSLQSVKTNAMRLVGPGARQEKRANFIFEASGGRLEANLALLAGEDRTVLWSRDFRQQQDAQSGVQQQMAYTAGQVLDCALEASRPDPGGINQDTLKLFLNGCDLFAEKYRTDPLAVVPIFKQLLENAPRFQPAWRKLLLAEALFTRTERLLHRHTPGELPEHIAAVRKLNPDTPELYLAQSVLVPINAFARRSELLDGAIRLDPGNPDLLLMRAEFFAGVGRMSESVEDANRAVELNPLSPGLRSHLIADLAYAGKIETAGQELLRAEQLWPNSAAIDDARFRLNNRYGNPGLAMQMLKSGQMRLQPMTSPMIEAFLIARIDPTDANIRRAMSEVEKRLASDPRGLSDLIQAAGEFHREEDLYRTLLDWRQPEMLRDLGEVLFRPTLAKFRQDARFMRVAAYSGLPDYWRQSGKWPDFCFSPDLPYDCKKEAAKLTA